MTDHQDEKVVEVPASVEAASGGGGHEKHCFVVMPHGRTASEIKHFRGWYEVVIKPAVIEATFVPILAAAEEQPGAINDDIRAHLAYDPMVVVDLGGAEPDEDPNPNVMYELGIRHALSLPLVMMAWQGQRLPFDVGNQRVIMEGREFVDIETNRRRLISFILAAAQGKYYRPMDAVLRIAQIEAAAVALGPDSILGVLAKEVRSLRSTMWAVMARPPLRRRLEYPMIKGLLEKKSLRKDIYNYFLSIGGLHEQWPFILRTIVTADFAAKAETWGVDEWKAYAASRLKDLPPPVAPEPIVAEEEPEEESPAPVPEEFLASVRALLPPQPWPSGTHKVVGEKLNVAPTQVSKAMRELVRRGICVRQVAGKLYPDDDSPSTVA
jgi:hypothetical protein